MTQSVGGWLQAHNTLLDQHRYRLLEDFANLSRAQAMSDPDRCLSPTQQTHLEDAVAQLSSGKPYEYITGTAHFWNLELDVTEDVLIPRPDTELLVELAVADSPTDARLCDLGTGSGAIALAVAASRKDVQVTACDMSPAALEVCASNARRNALQDRLQLLAGDWLTAVPGAQFDVIVSNPPYIRQGDPHLSALKHEPEQALVCGDGYAALSKIIRNARQHLTAGGWLGVEHGYDQGPVVSRLFAHYGYELVSAHNDLQGIHRVTRGHWQ